MPPSCWQLDQAPMAVARIAGGMMSAKMMQKRGLATAAAKPLVPQKNDMASELSIKPTQAVAAPAIKNARMIGVFWPRKLTVLPRRS
eukprot:50811-Pleurochrysis_carterae.AAC.3